MSNDGTSGIIFEIDDPKNVSFEIGDDNGAIFENGNPVIGTGTRDYEKLVKKPTINNREIIGDKTIEYYLQDGLIVDGGYSLSFDPPEEEVP